MPRSTQIAPTRGPNHRVTIFTRLEAEIDAFVHVNKDRTPTRFGAFLTFDEIQDSTDRVWFGVPSFKVLTPSGFSLVQCSFGEDAFKHGFVVWVIENQISFECFVSNQLDRSHLYCNNRCYIDKQLITHCWIIYI